MILSAAMALIPVSAVAETWSLDSCISYALSHNISVKQQDLRIKEGEYAIKEAQDLSLIHI